MADYSELLKQIREGVSTPTPPVMTEEEPVTAPEGLQQTDYSEMLKGIRESMPVAPTPTTTTEAPAAPVDYTQMTYSETDLTGDDFYLPIKNYMVDRFGVQINDASREDVVEMFTNNMRGFSGGNSVRAINEITYLNEVSEDPDKVVNAGRAYEIYEGLQSLAGDTTLGEKAEIVGDFARAAVLDPVNVLSLGIGKVFTGTGFKAGSQVALIAAKQAYKRQIAKGVTAEVAQQVAERVLRAQTSRAVAQTGQRIAQRQAVEKTATTLLQRMTTPTALKEAAAVGTFEAAVSAGTDYLYQDAMLRTKVQDEYNVYQTGLSAVVGLVAGGLSGAASNVGAGGSKLVAPAPLKTTTKGTQAITGLVNQTAVQAPGTTSPPAGNWLKDIAKGKELTDQDNQFFVTMLLGDDTKGLKGLAQILLEDGYSWTRRTPDDKVSNWVGDIIKNSDPQDAKQFLDDFSQATGIDMVEGKTLTIENFADTFKKKMSDSGKVLNSVSQVARLLGRKESEVTGEDYAQFILGGGVPEVTTKASAAGAKVGKVVGDLVNRDLPDFQNNIIRLMVSNLSTTALNVTGFAAATGLNSATDVVRAALLGGQAGLYMVYKPKEAKALGLNALSIMQNQVTKARNTLDINTTYDTFLQYSQVRPQAMRQLTAILPGGVESLDKIAKGFDPSKPLLTMKMDQTVDFIQRLNFVSAQDGYTKAVEFTSQLDKLLRRPKDEGGFGMSWNEFFAQPNHPAQMISERFVNLEAMAVDSTLKAVFSKSYKGKDFLGEVAGIIEDARNLPGIGLLVPFGRFFNNTVAMTYDMTAVGPLISKAMGGQADKFTSEIAAKGIVSWTLIGLLAQREQQFMAMGLGWSEEIDEQTGEVLDERYEFPYGAYKAIARVVAHYWNDEEVPAELVTQLGDQFVGQLTRQLGEAGTGVGEIAKSILSDEGPGLSSILQDTMGTVVSQAMSGITRPLEPVNVLAGLTRDEEFYTPDRKQGTKWLNNSLRYMDQMVALATGEDLAPPVFSAAEGQPRVQASRLVSTTRASRLTNTERVMNTISRPGYMANMASQSEAADNRYNQVFNEIVETGAGKLFESKKFKEGDLELRQNLVSNLLESARKSTKAYMGRLASKDNDRVLLKMIEVSGYPKLQVQRTLSDLGFDRGVDELSEEELISLSNALKFREEFINQQ